MRYLSIIGTAVCCVILVVTSVSCRQETLSSTTQKKKVVPQCVYINGSPFKNIEPTKEIISSINVFGNPPKPFIDECHQNHIEVYQAVGGNEETIDTPQKRKALVEEYVSDCSANGYGGIDFDLEHLDPDIQGAYTEFLKLASKGLHAVGKELGHCVSSYPALYQDSETKMFHDPAILNTTCDLIRVMYYDMYFAPGIDKPEFKHRDDCVGIEPTSNCLWTKGAMFFWMKHIPNNKLVMALPACANDYAVTGDIKGRQVYQSVPDSMDRILPPPTWLCYEKVNICLYDDTDGNRHLFYASNTRSTEALLKLADELGISQIGFWHFNSVDPQMWDTTTKWQKK